ncbi:hypothetical protein P8452_55939 [Trifolium repens]|nr:hypothetical protein P8452_55939 [Trifolium repens]
MEKKHEILEIGCGWGSLAIEDVKRTGCNSNLQKKELKMLAFSYSFSMITTFEQLKFAEERVKDVDIQVISHETSLVARCRRVYAHAHDYHINSISNNRHLKCKKLEDLRLSSINAFSLVNLTEHMLLYANEKNLVEDSYSKYITEVVVRFLAFCSLLE